MNDTPHRTAGTATNTLLLSAQPGSSGVARRTVRQLCSDAHVGVDDADTAVLLTSELVTNAVVHTDQAAVLDVAIRDRTVRVAVTDRSPCPVRLPTGLPPDAASGRGLALVSALADRWGHGPARSGPLHLLGKTVWFELDVA